MDITEPMVAGYIAAVATALTDAGHHTIPSYLAHPDEPITATIQIPDVPELGGGLALIWEPVEGAMGQGWTAAVYSAETGGEALHTDLRLGVVPEPGVVARSVAAIAARGRLEDGRVVPGTVELLSRYATL